MALGNLRQVIAGLYGISNLGNGWCLLLLCGLLRFAEANITGVSGSGSFVCGTTGAAASIMQLLSSAVASKALLLAGMRSL